MSKKWIINRDGNVAGPLTTQQLQQMAAAGSLLPHHMVREEKSPRWNQASTIRGLFAAATPTAGPAMPAATDNPFASWEGETSANAAAEPNAFDFFSQPAAEPPKPPAPAPANTPSSADTRPAPPRAAAPVKTPAPATIAEPTPAVFAPPAPKEAEIGEENPFSFGPAAAPPPESITAKPKAASPPVVIAAEPPTITPADEPMPAQFAAESASMSATDNDNPFAFVAPEPPAPKISSKPSPPKITISEAPPSEPLTPDPSYEPIGAPAAEAGTFTPSPTPMRAVAESAVEFSGQALDLVSDGDVRLLDGKTLLRLQRYWLLAVTKFKDGTQRTTYLRLPHIDAATIEHRFEAGRGQVGTHLVLALHAGAVEVAVLAANEKAARSFVEKCLLQASAATKTVGK